MLNDCGELVINKERLVCKGYDQIKGLDFDETFSRVAILEDIIRFLAFFLFPEIQNLSDGCQICIS